MTWSGPSWSLNWLGYGGTTHPNFALTSPADGAYNALGGEYRTRNGAIKHYAATDHLDSPA